MSLTSGAILGNLLSISESENGSIGVVIRCRRVFLTHSAVGEMHNRLQGSAYCYRSVLFVILDAKHLILLTFLLFFLISDSSNVCSS